MDENAGEPVELRGRFADEDATEEVDLGPCRCPGAVHGRDSATIRAEVGDGEFRSALAAATRFRDDGSSYTDPAAADDSVATRFTLSWTLLDRHGKPVRITPRAMSLLDEASRLAVMAPLQKVIDRQREASLPNASGARSPGSSPASASPNRAARRRR
jgi:hypothetical protein